MTLKKPETEHLPTGLPCSISELLVTLDDVDRTEFQSWLDGPYSAQAIWTALRADGHRVSLQQINRHRHGFCRCHK